MKPRWLLFLLPFCLAVVQTQLWAAELDPLVTSWIEVQTNMQSWSADFIQTRTLKSLSQPLTATGRVF